MTTICIDGAKAGEAAFLEVHQKPVRGAQPRACPGGGAGKYCMLHSVIQVTVHAQAWQTEAASKAKDHQFLVGGTKCRMQHSGWQRWRAEPPISQWSWRTLGRSVLSAVATVHEPLTQCHTAGCSRAAGGIGSQGRQDGDGAGRIQGHTIFRLVGATAVLGKTAAVCETQDAAERLAGVEARAAKMAAELADFKTEAATLRNQDLTVRRLEDRNKALEAQLAEKVVHPKHG